MSSDYRYEIKFVFNNASLSTAMKDLYSNTTIFKKYDNRTVNSIYFDNLNFSSVRDNLAGTPKRNKMRLRWYGKLNNSVPSFEIKIKNGRLGFKTSYSINSIGNNISKINIDKITSFCKKDLAEQNFILDEYIVPTLKVSYEREYYETHNGIRITIDHDLLFSETQLYSMINEDNSKPYAFKVMEIKFKPQMKEEVAKLINPFHVTPKRHSKYLVGLSTLGYATYI